MLKKRFIHFLAFMLLTFVSMAQSPGGVSSGLSLWLKANTTVPANITYNTTTNKVSNWKSDVGTYQVSQATVAKQPQLTNTWPTSAANFNYNPFIQFNSANAATLLNTSTTPNLVGTSGSIIMITNKNQAAATSPTLLAYYSSSTVRFQIKPSFRVQNGYGSLGYKFDINLLTGAIINYPQESAFILSNVGSGATSRARRNATDFGAPTGLSSTFFPAITGGLHLNESGSAALYSDMGIAEVIMYNSAIAPADMQKIESYLAIKYGITLDELASQSTNYIASDATIVWNKTSNTGYNENITAIAKDDASGLNQKQSRSVNTNGLVSVFNGNTNGTFPNMNDSNTTTIATDKSFFMFGDNNDDTTLNVCIRNGYMTGMKRIWKVNETGSIGAITLALENSVLPTAKTLLVSTNPAFPDNATTVYNLNNGSKKYYSIDLASGQYFTFATDSTALPTFASTPICAGANGTASITNPKTGAIYKWYTQATGGTSVNTGTSIAATNILSSTTYYVETTTPSNCILPVRVPVTIQVTPPPAAPIVTTPVNVCLNATANPLTATGTILLWHTTAIGGTASTTAPTPSTLAIGNTTYYVSQSSVNGCVGLRAPIVVSVKALPIVSAGGDKIILNGENTQLDGAAQNYTSFSWFPVTSNSLTPLVAPNATTTYTLTATNSFGCSAKDSALVTVIPYCVKVMNAFTPNGDGKNDLWLVTSGGSCTKLVTAQVYNRYGTKVYESDNYLNNWDGKYEGKPLPDATYYYVLNFNLINGSGLTLKGDVTILR